MTFWHYIIAVLIVALVFYLACKAVIGSYFKAKRGYVNELLDKLKGASNGK
jgi:hypothetical protein